VQDVKDFYNENYESLKKEIEVQIRRSKDLLCSWISRLNMSKWLSVPKVIYMFSAIPIKILEIENHS
jgi:hypothetical protein